MYMLHRFIAVFRQVKSNSKFSFFEPFFYFGGHFGIKKGPIDLCFSNHFQNLRKICFKMAPITSYLSFHLKSRKIIFRCRFYPRTVNNDYVKFFNQKNYLEGVMLHEKSVRALQG